MSIFSKVALGLDKDKQSDIRFGNLKYVQIYEIHDDELAIVEADLRDVPDISNFKSSDEFSCHGKNEEFLNALGELLADCKYLIIGESGGNPSRVLLRHGISVLEQQDDIAVLLEKLRNYEKGEKR